MPRTKAEDMNAIDAIDEKELENKRREVKAELDRLNSKNEKVQEATAQSNERETYNILMKQERVRCIIPIDPLLPKDTTLNVGINGNNFVYPRGKEISIPKDIYTMLKERKKVY